MAYNYYEFQSVIHNISRTVHHIWVCRCKIMISPGFLSLFFFLKIQNCKYYNSYIFYWPTSTVFLINSCLQFHQQMPNRSSEVCPTFFTCVWFFCMNGFDGFLWMTSKYFYLQQLSILPITSSLLILKVISNIFSLLLFKSQKSTFELLMRYWNFQILES